jgi:hypothetical protein
MAAAVAGPEARHADQPLDLSLLHRGDEQERRTTLNLKAAAQFLAHPTIQSHPYRLTQEHVRP